MDVNRLIATHFFMWINIFYFVSLSTDWIQYGFDIRRSGYNLKERVLVQSAFDSNTLSLMWNVSLNGASVSQPLVIGSLIIPNLGTITVVYVGTDGGDYMAINAASGMIIWKRHLGAYIDLNCFDLPQNSFGFTGTGYIDRYYYQSIFVVSGLGALYRLQLIDGTTVSPWPLNVYDPSVDHSYGAITYYNGILYLTTASRCDSGYYFGKVIAVSIGAVKVIRTFFATDASKGNFAGGIWGAGGLSIDTTTTPATLYTAIGNSDPIETADYGESVVKLSINLTAEKYWSPGTLIGDDDFGATPLIFNPTNKCNKTLTATENKYGTLYIIDSTFRSIQTLDIMFPQAEGTYSLHYYYYLLLLLLLLMDVLISFFILIIILKIFFRTIYCHSSL